AVHASPRHHIHLRLDPPPRLSPLAIAAPRHLPQCARGSHPLLLGREVRHPPAAALRHHPRTPSHQPLVEKTKTLKPASKIPSSGPFTLSTNHCPHQLPTSTAHIPCPHPIAHVNCP